MIRLIIRPTVVGMRGLVRRTMVLVADKMGWLNMVDDRIVKDYLNPKSIRIRELEKLFKDYSGFFMGSPTPITCVEVAFRDGYVAVRNSKDPNKTTAFFTYDEWRAFIQAVKHGKFDID